MKSYICTKILKAEPMDEATFRDVHFSKDLNRLGYYVRYPGLVHSCWLPKDVFESAHRLITEAECDLEDEMKDYFRAKGGEG